jgi:anti-sigma B factor antagonist
MPFQSSERDVSGVTIFDLSGRLTLGSETESFTNLVDSITEKKLQNVLFNLQQLGKVDSTGLGVLVMAHSRVSELGGSVRLLHLSSHHRDLLILTKLTLVFQSFDDEQNAIDSFFPDRASQHFDILEFVQSQRRDAETNTKEAGEEAAEPRADAKAPAADESE